MNSSMARNFILHRRWLMRTTSTNNNTFPSFSSLSFVTTPLQFISTLPSTLLLPASDKTMESSTATTTTKMYFHSTPIQNLPVRRRRRGSGGGSSHSDNQNNDNNNNNDSGTKSKNNQHIPIVDPIEFTKQGLEFLIKIETAVRPMQAQNEMFVIKRQIENLENEDLIGCLTIELDPKFGKYTMEMNAQTCTMHYNSPISGSQIYIVSSATNPGEWVGVQDGHSFEGILVRDLIRHCNGLPNL